MTAATKASQQPSCRGAGVVAALALANFAAVGFAGSHIGGVAKSFAEMFTEDGSFNAQLDDGIGYRAFTSLAFSGALRFEGFILATPALNAVVLPGCAIVLEYQFACGNGNGEESVSLNVYRSTPHAIAAPFGRSFWWDDDPAHNDICVTQTISSGSALDTVFSSNTHSRGAHKVAISYDPNNDRAFSVDGETPKTVSPIATAPLTLALSCSRKRNSGTIVNQEARLEKLTIYPPVPLTQLASLSL